MKTAQQAASNWTASQGRASAAWSAGVQAYNGDWAAATVAQEGALLTGVTQAITSGRWRAGVQKTGTTGWKTATEAKAPNYSQGFSAGAPKQAAAIAKIMQFLGTVVPNLPARGT